MGRLSAAGISFNTQPSPAAVAAAIDLAAQVIAALSPGQHTLTRLVKTDADRYLKHTGQQPQQALPLPPLYRNALQQQQQQQQPIRGPDGPIVDCVPASAAKGMLNHSQLWSLGGPVVCFYGSQLLQQWEQQLLQQQQQSYANTPAAAAAGESSGGSGDGGGSSSSSRSMWQEAEGMLLLAAAALEGSSQHQHHQQLQQRQQQIALCRQYQQQFQQAASDLGFSKEVMAAMAVCSIEAEQYSSSSGEGVAAGSSAAVDCLSSVCAAAQMLVSVQTVVDPSKRARSSASWKATAGQELLVADFFLKVCHSTPKMS